jgi:hypothetical protein
LAVVVTHDALGINELFNKFSEGEEAILLEEEVERFTIYYLINFWFQMEKMGQV